MKATQPIIKLNQKQTRELKVLFGLIEHYLKTGHPVGSNTLREMGFEDLSAATIRNYFVSLEEEGYLTQQHTSGGRIPTHRAYRLYANQYLDKTPREESLLEQDFFKSLRSNETKEIAAFLQEAAENLSKHAQAAVFLSAPRFEQDFITQIKLIVIDHSRCLCVLITDFGEVISEILQTDRKLNLFSAKRIESYFNWRINGQNPSEELPPEEKQWAQQLYNELMVRYVVDHRNFNNEGIYRTGLSALLAYPELCDPKLLMQSLSLFENRQGMRLLLRECEALNQLKFWIGEDLIPYSDETAPEAAVIAIPYKVNNQPIGAIAVLGPIRCPYRRIFALLHEFSESLSEALTNSLYKFKIEIYPKTEQKGSRKPIHAITGPEIGPLLIT